MKRVEKKMKGKDRGVWGGAQLFSKPQYKFRVMCFSPTFEDFKYTFFLEKHV